LGSDQAAKGLTLSSIELIGSTDKVTFDQTADALQVKLPASASCKYAYVLKIAVK